MTKVPLAWRNLMHDKRRLLVSMAGVMFAVILIFMQLGYKNALFDTSFALINELNGDIFLISSVRVRTESDAVFSRRRMFQALEHEDVIAAYPVYSTLAGDLRNPDNGKRVKIRVLGIRPNDPVFLSANIKNKLGELKSPNTLLWDNKSRRKYGKPKLQQNLELSGRTIRVAGKITLGPGFVAEGNIIVSDKTFLTMFPGTKTRAQLDSVSFGLLQLKPGADHDSVVRSLRNYLPNDVLVMTKAEIIAFEKSYWDKQSAIGPVFNMGAFIGLIVGLIICYQIIFTDLSDQLPQFATLKAIGNSNAYLMRVVVTQSFFLSLVSFLPALGCSYLLYMYVGNLTGMIMHMTPELVLLMFCLSIIMCVGAGSIAVRKVLMIEPAELF